MRKKRTHRRRKLLNQAPEHRAPRRHETEAAHVARRTKPERRCVATGETLSPDEGLRFVISPDGELAPDFSGKLPGRGAWLSPLRDALEMALKKGAFARSFKAPVRVPDDLAVWVECGIEKAALSALGLARRAGDVAVGFEKARAALVSGEAAVLINAADGAQGGRGKLQKAAAGPIAVVDLFDEAMLAAALGRDAPTVHVTIRQGPAARRFLADVKRLEGFRRR